MSMTGFDDWIHAWVSGVFEKDEYNIYWEGGTTALGSFGAEAHEPGRSNEGASGAFRLK